MPTYRYQAVDTEGKPAAGQLEAATIDDARRQLAEQGLTVAEDALVEVVRSAPTSERLSSGQAAELAGQVAQLAKARLPLAPGLRALAQELDNRRLARVLRRLAARLDAGATLEGAIEALGNRFPAHVRGLILAGIRSSKLAEVLDDFVDLERYRTELRRRMCLILAYPALLMSTLIALLVLFNTILLPEFVKLYGQFALTLPLVTQIVLAVSGPLAWLLAGGTAALVVSFVLLWMLPGTAGSDRLLHFIPLLGPMRRWSRLMRFSRLLGLLLDEQIPLPEALRLTALGLHDESLAAGCREVATEVEAGRPLAESLASHRQFPPSLIPLVEWGQRTQALPEAFRTAAEMFQGRVHVQTDFLDVIILPFIFLLIVGTVPMLISALFVPLISLIHNLS